MEVQKIEDDIDDLEEVKVPQYEQKNEIVVTESESNAELVKKEKPVKQKVLYPKGSYVAMKSEDGPNKFNIAMVSSFAFISFFYSFFKT